MFTKYMAHRIGLHNFCHGLLDQRLHAWEPVAVGWPQIIHQVHANHNTGGWQINTHGIQDLEEMWEEVEMDDLHYLCYPGIQHRCNIQYCEYQNCPIWAVCQSSSPQASELSLCKWLWPFSADIRTVLEISTRGKGVIATWCSRGWSDWPSAEVS